MKRVCAVFRPQGANRIAGSVVPVSASSLATEAAAPAPALYRTDNIIRNTNTNRRKLSCQWQSQWQSQCQYPQRRLLSASSSSSLVASCSSPAENSLKRRRISSISSSRWNKSMSRGEWHWHWRFQTVATLRNFSTNLDHGSSNNNGSSEGNNTEHCLRIYNTLTGRLQSLESRSPAEASENADANADDSPLGLGWYTCGPTTYAPAHLGHARTYVCLDMVRRVLEASNNNINNNNNNNNNINSEQQQQQLPPLFVLNITDVDDKILAAAFENREDPVDLARRYERDFWRDWDALNCLRPHIVTRVTENVESAIVPFVKALVEKGMAYVVPHDGKNENENSNTTVGGVYFDVRAYNEQLGHLTKYGKLAPPAASRGIEDILKNNHNRNNKTDSINTKINKELPPLPSATTTTTTTTKRDPRDFVLWKTRPPGREDVLSWPSPWGPGRPGWHIECSAMIQAVQDRFAETHRFGVHAGGIDLKFPHHTNEIAQSEAYLGSGDWIRHWIHTGHLHIDGLKMSKSLKNFVAIRDFLAGDLANDGDGDGQNCQYQYHPSVESRSDDFRLWCLGLSGSYRGPATFSQKRMDEARSVRSKLVESLREGEAWIRESEQEQDDATTITDNDDTDRALLVVAGASKKRALSALRNDLDGRTFLSEVLAMADSANDYRRNPSGGACDAPNRRRRRRPVEPLVWTLREIRGLLGLVGFTRATTEAGMVAHHQTEDYSFGGLGNGYHHNAQAEDIAIVNCLIGFRYKVRAIALKDTSSEGMRELLALSDELRDSVLPELGIRLSDDATTAAGGNGNAGWKFNVLSNPKQTRPSPGDDETVRTEAATLVNQQSDNNEAPPSSSSPSPFDPAAVPLQDLFKVGPYEHQFSAYSEEDGMPTHNADGSEISKRLFKKLSKKREKHKNRLANANAHAPAKEH